MCPRSFCKKEGTTTGRTSSRRQKVQRNDGSSVGRGSGAVEQRPSGVLQKGLAADGSSSGWKKYLPVVILEVAADNSW